ncbi:hypothetical protein [Flavobacterium aestivum]|uniref:hypothetical protein n=1 Tax=Flavobacterium aestivum TaxID=3003257 RepID=UPI00228587D3|nr:hypothetical protein [Flavobacterium aestivum]
MLKEILSLKGAQKLTVNEQKSIKAGDLGVSCGPLGPPCGPGQVYKCGFDGKWVCVSTCPVPYPGC